MFANPTISESGNGLDRWQINACLLKVYLFHKTTSKVLKPPPKTLQQMENTIYIKHRLARQKRQASLVQLRRIPYNNECTNREFILQTCTRRWRENCDLNWNQISNVARKLKLAWFNRDNLKVLKHTEVDCGSKREVNYSMEHENCAQKNEH